MPQRAKRWSLARLFLGSLLAVYAYLLVITHRLEQSSQQQKASAVRAPSPFRAPGANEENIDTDGKNLNSTALLPPTPNWRHGIFDGRISQYEGHDLWESTNLPQWMTGTWETVQFDDSKDRRN